MTEAGLDLAEIRERLLKRREDLLTRTRRIESDLRREADPLSADAPDQAIQRGNDDVLQAIEGAALTELQAVENALQRLKAGRYLTCEECGALIEAERLSALPYTGRCRACASQA